MKAVSLRKSFAGEWTTVSSGVITRVTVTTHSGSLWFLRAALTGSVWQW